MTNRYLLLIGLLFAIEPAFGEVAAIEMPLPKKTYIVDVGGEAEIQTIEEGLATIAKLRLKNSKRPLALRIAPGDYFPTQQLVVTRHHASKEMASLFIYAADFSKKPHIHQATRITGWQKVAFNKQKDVWVADVSKMTLTKNPKETPRPRQLNFNGARLRLARWPNIDPDNPYLSGSHPAKAASSSANVTDAFSFQQPAKGARVWANPSDGWVVGSNGRREVVSVEGNTVRLKPSDKPPSEDDKPKPWKDFYVENMAEELDEPGEWYFDPREKKIYLIAPDRIDPNTVVVTVAKSGAAWTFQHCAKAVVAGLEFSGGRGDGVRLLRCDGVHLLGCAIHDFGDSGVFLEARHSRIKDCDIFRTRHGVFVTNQYGDNWSVEGRQNNLIENNYIHHLVGSGAGVWIWGQGVAVRHNLMHDLPGAGVKGFGRFCDISYNRIRHVMTHFGDYGAIYDDRWSNGVGSTVSCNWISDVIGRKGTSFFREAVGIYMDECSGGLKIYGNLVERAHIAGVHLHNGRWATISNNVFISNGCDANIYTYQLSIQPWHKSGFLGKPAQDNYGREYTNIVRGEPRWREYPSMAQDPNKDEGYAPNGSMIMGVQVVNNIFYYPDQAAGALMTANGMDVTTNFFNRNVYWLGKKSKEMLRMRVGNGMNSWKEWRKNAKQDKDSVIADPQFRDVKRHDYRLRPSSQAFKLGFWELPYEKMGLQKSRFRPVLPKEAEGVREHPEWLTGGKKKKKK